MGDDDFMEPSYLAFCSTRTPEQQREALLRTPEEIREYWERWRDIDRAFREGEGLSPSAA